MKSSLSMKRSTVLTALCDQAVVGMTINVPHGNCDDERLQHPLLIGTLRTSKDAVKPGRLSPPTGERGA